MVNRISNIVGKNSKPLPLFVPLLVLYLGFVIGIASDKLVGDEIRFMAYATNLTNGFYTQADNPELINGPVYPMVLALFKLLDSPLLIPKLLNAILLFMAVFFFYKSILLLSGQRCALLLAYIFGLYPPFFKCLPYLYSDILAVFLVSGLLYYSIRIIRSSNMNYRHLIFATLFLGALTLTKVIFGYVIILTGLFYLFLYVVMRNKKTRAVLLILVGGFIICTPYLAYTYKMTNKVFYWGTQGGELLYWRSSPFPGEYGDWIYEEVVMGRETNNFYDQSKLIENHRPFYKELEPLNVLQRDELFKKKAISNMKEHPLKYLQNTVASGTRLFFNYPHSYTPQKMTSFFYIIPNGLLLAFLLLAFYLGLRVPRGIPFEVRFIALFACIYIGGIIMANGLARYLLPVIPLLLACIIFVMNRLIRLELRQPLDE